MLKRILVISVLSLPAPMALAQSTEALTARYANLAGTKEHSATLVDGLRKGTELTFADGTKYTPPTGRMGNGNVDHALALAEASLSKQGIDNPTSAQLRSELDRILQQRADGKGWGQIAQAQGIKLGEVKRAEPASARAAERGERVAQRPERPARAEKPERPERPARPDKPERAGR